MSETTHILHKLGRLTKRPEFLFVANRNGRGRFAAQTSLIIQMRNNPSREAGINCGFTATKKTGNAVVRNRAKRRMRECANALLPTLGHAGHDYVFIARQATAKAKWQTLYTDVEKALLRLK